jgi:hypothetical protein
LLHVEQGELHSITPNRAYIRSQELLGPARDGRLIGMFQTYFILNQQLKQWAVDKMQFMVFSGI